METECVVCGSANDYRSLRCFVCGAELPPKATGHAPLSETDEGYQSFQAINPPMRTPLSVGALPLEEILSRRPIEQGVGKQSMSNDHLDVLLGPEELDLSSPPPTMQLSGVKEEESRSLAPPIDSLDKLDQDPPATWIGIPSVESSQSLPREPHLTDQEQTRAEVESPPHQLGSEYSPISQLLRDHRREETSSLSPSQTQKTDSKPSIEIPRQTTLTGAELKQIEAESTPSKWEQTAQTSEEEVDEGEVYSSIKKPLAVPGRSKSREVYETDDEIEGETALKISIPNLLAVGGSMEDSGPEQPLKESFVPVSSLPHAKVVIEPAQRVAGVDQSSFVTLEDNDSSISIQERTERLHVDDLGRANFRSSSLSPLSWLVLTISSISVGIVIALYLMPTHRSVAKTSLKVSEISRENSIYRVKLKLSADPSAQLLIPDSYVSADQAPLIEVRGTSDVELEIPKDQIKIGENLITLQWLYQETGATKKISKPIDISIPVYYRREDPRFSSDRGGYLLPIELNPRYQIASSNHEFQPAERDHHYVFFLSTESVRGKESVSVEAMIKDSSGHERALSWRFSPPHESLPLKILSPVNRYARPDSEVTIVGQSSSRAIVRLSALSVDGQKVDDLPQIEVKADHRGRFELSIPLKTTVSNTEGVMWHATVSALELSGELQSKEVMIKQSHRPTWSQYIQRLAKRRERAGSRYRRLSLKGGVKGVMSVKSRARMLSGVIAFIDRGDQKTPQRLLIHTCRQNDGCPVWVEDKDAFWVKRNQKVSVFGVVIGMGSYLAQNGHELTAPEVRARLTTPGKQ